MGIDWQDMGNTGSCGSPPFHSHPSEATQRSFTQLREDSTWGLVGFRALEAEFLVNSKMPVVENTVAESSTEDPETGLGMTGMGWLR